MRTSRCAARSFVTLSAYLLQVVRGSDAGLRTVSLGNRYSRTSEHNDTEAPNIGIDSAEL